MVEGQGSLENHFIYKRTMIEFLVYNMFTNVFFLMSKKKIELTGSL